MPSTPTGTIGAETGKTFDEAVEDLVAVSESALVFSEAVLLHIPPAGVTGLVDAHQIALDAAGKVATGADAVLAGLRAPDTGQLRQAALVEFRSAAEQFNLAVDSINSIITQTSGGVGAHGGRGASNEPASDCRRVASIHTPTEGMARADVSTCRGPEGSPVLSTYSPAASLHTVLVIRRVTTYGSQLAFGRRSSR